MGKQNESRATIATVARAAGVSSAAASLALNGKSGVTAETRERVRRHAIALGYYPNLRAKRLRTGRSNSFGIITTAPAPLVGGSSHLGFLLEMALSAAQTGLERNYSLVLVPPLEEAESLAQLDIDGAVVIDPLQNDPFVNLLNARALTVVTVGKADGCAVAATVDRGPSGAEVILPHLRQEGGQNIAVLTTHETHGVTAAVTDYANSWSVGAGCAVTHVGIPRNTGETGGYEATMQSLRENPDIDSIYAPFDAFAVGAARAAKELGLRMPEDLMIATNYDGPRAQAATPPLTALDLKLEAIAGTAVTLLLDHLDTSYATELIQAPSPTLIRRRSTDRTGRSDRTT